MNSPAQPAAVTPQQRGTLLTRLISYFFYVPVVYLYTAVFGTASLLSSLFDRDGSVQHQIARAWARLILKTGTMPLRVHGIDRLPKEPAVYAANHLSALDIPVLYTVLPMPFRIMAKKELFAYPFLGWHLKRSGQIPIYPGDARSALRSLSHASESLRKGMPLVVFPEGGRSENGQLQPFMKGAFYTAIKAQAPVVPITLVNLHEILPMNSFHAIPNEILVFFGEPIPTKGMATREMEKLAGQVYRVISETYYAHAKIAPPDQETIGTPEIGQQK